MPKVHLINPTLSKNIPTVVALMKSVHGTNPGRLHTYEVYTLDDGKGGTSSFALTLPVLQFVEDSVPDSRTPEFRLDIVEPTSEDNGQFGHILPVVKSIISTKGEPVFDQERAYVIKEINADQNALSDKPNKPHWFVRSANRERYLGGQLPTLGIRYGLIKEEHLSFLHMNRAPGLPLDTYVNKLNAEQFLSLVCTLLEEIPEQIHQTVRSGKHEGKKIVHCDLKSQNIMAEWKNNKWTVTAVDMGLAKTMQGNHYTTLRPQGNLMVCDSKMLLAALRKEPIIYDAQTDLYALYVTIAELAGAPSRDSLNNETMLADLKKPNLTGIFNHMDFDPLTQQKLIHLVERMLCDDRNQRIPREEALKEFQEILLYVQKNNANLLQKRTSLTSETVPLEKKKSVTAEEMKNWVEQKLDHLIIQNELNGQDKRTTVQLWIKHFLELCSKTDENEIDRFNTMRSKKEFRIYSRLIYDLIRFNLINQYDDKACARLLLRNEQLTAPLKGPYPLNETWQKFFDMYLSQLPIQLTSLDESFCEEIGRFKRNVSDILHSQIVEDQESLLWHMKEALKLQSGKQFTHQVEQLPLFAHVFNRQYECMQQVSKLFLQFKHVFTLKDNFSQEFNSWAEEICMNAINGKFPNDPEYFEKYHDLAYLLIDFDRHKKELGLLFDAFPVLNQSAIGFAAIEQSIKNFKLNDTQSFEDLSQKLELLFILEDVFSNLDPKKGYPHTKYLTVMETGINQLTKLISQYPPEQEFIVELQSLLNYFEAINDLDEFIGDFDFYEHIVKAILLLMNDDKSKVLKLGEMISEVPEQYLGLLEQGLESLLSQESGGQLNEKLFAELIRFFALPPRYQPMATRPNPHILFQPASSKAEEEDLLVSALSL